MSDHITPKTGTGMSAIEIAAQMIRDLSEVEGGTLGYAHAHNIAEALADAGLLQPDLPEPDNDDYGVIWDQVFNYQEGPDWRDVKGYVASYGGAVEIVGNETHIHTPAEVRHLAYVLLAAANHAEKENKNA